MSSLDASKEESDLFSRKSFPSGAELKRESVRSATVTVTTQVVSLALHTGSTVVLARLLTPQDYGLVAMVLVLTTFARRFQDLGLSSATIQKDALTHEQISTIFWLNVAVGGGLTLVVAGLGPTLAWFYKRPEVLWITLVSSTNFLIGSLGAQHAVLLKRQMRFQALAARQIIGLSLGIAVSIGAALLGFAYWALVFGELTTSVCGTILLWRSSGWKPGPPRRDAGVRGLLRFGANVTGFEMANYFARNADNLLIGKVWGADALGLYSKAYSLLMLPINNLRGPLNDVAFPALSHLRQDASRYRQYFRRYLSTLAFASMPIAAFLFVSSDNLIQVVLGDRWAESARIFGVLAITGFVQPTASARGLVLITTGNDGRYLRFGLWNAGVCVAAFLIGVNWGAVGVAVAYGIANYLMLYPSLRYCYAKTPIRVRDFFESVARAAVSSVMAGVAGFYVKHSLQGSNDVVVLFASGVAFLCVYFLIFKVMPGGGSELREYLSFRSYFLRPKPAAHLEQ